MYSPAAFAVVSLPAAIGNPPRNVAPCQTEKCVTDWFAANPVMVTSEAKIRCADAAALNVAAVVPVPSAAVVPDAPGSAECNRTALTVMASRPRLSAVVVNGI